MTLEAVISLFLASSSLGATYALAALGFVLVLNAAGAVNFAHGEQVMLGGLLGAVLAPIVGSDAVFLLLLLPILGAMGGFGVALLARRLTDRGDPARFYVATIALGSLLQQSALSLAGPAPRPAPPLPGGGSPLALLLAAGSSGVAVWLLLTQTRLGRQLRAAALDAEMARLLGLNVPRLAAIAFGLGGALAALAGVLLARPFLVTPFDGGGYMLRAYLAAALGGWGSLPGAALGGLLLGLIESFGSYWLGPLAAEASLYVAVLAVLQIRPRGLIAEPIGRRA